MSLAWKNTESAWGAVAKGFHWLLAILILGQLALDKIADDAALSPRKLDLFVWHKSIGVTILLLVLLRIAWRLSNPAPLPPAAVPRWETVLAKSGHTLLYGLLFLVPISGWWVSDSSRVPFKAFWLLPMPDLLPPDRSVQELAEGVHGALTKVLLGLVIVHIVAALRHHVVLRNDILRRMLPDWRKRD
jgi:cytochrome b561